MRFKQFSIKDDQGFKDMEVFHGVMPADWNIKGGAIWRSDLATHQLFRIHWGEANNSYAPPVRYVFLPVIILTGLWMWKGYLVRRLFTRKTAS